MTRRLFLAASLAAAGLALAGVPAFAQSAPREIRIGYQKNGPLHRGEVADVLAQATGLDAASWRRAVERTDFKVGPVTPEVIAEQQRVADRFYRLGLIPNPISVKDIVWTWTPNS